MTTSFSTSPFLTFEDGYFIDSSMDQSSFFIVSFGPSDGTVRRCQREAGTALSPLKAPAADPRIGTTHKVNNYGEIVAIEANLNAHPLSIWASFYR